MNYKELFEKGAGELKKAGVSEAELDSRLLLEYVCKTDHSTLFAHPDKEISQKEEETYLDFIKRRSNREPLAYIVGSRGFMGLDFIVSSDVLIPEQDTEILVEEALRFCEDGMRILDLCTGSGCISLSILSYTNGTSAVCTDISQKALDVARENAALLKLTDRTEFVCTDLFPKENKAKFDLIVSNPPYIASDIIETLAPEVKDYEPRIALDGTSDGLEFYRRIIDGVQDYLYSSGYLLMEIGYDQREAVLDLLMKNGKFHDIEAIKDYSGNDRVIRACFY